MDGFSTFEEFFSEVYVARQISLKWKQLSFFDFDNASWICFTHFLHFSGTGNSTQGKMSFEQKKIGGQLGKNVQLHIPGRSTEEKREDKSQTDYNFSQG